LTSADLEAEGVQKVPNHQIFVNRPGSVVFSVGYVMRGFLPVMMMRVGPKPHRSDNSLVAEDL
jgi:hypothetical protein